MCPEDVRSEPLDDVEFQDFASLFGEADRGPTVARNCQNTPTAMGMARDEDG